MHEHAATGTVLLGVMDGHGEAGDLVSHFVSERIAPRVFRHPEFTTNPCTAIAEVSYHSMHAPQRTRNQEHITMM